MAIAEIARRALSGELTTSKVHFFQPAEGCGSQYSSSEFSQEVRRALAGFSARAVDTLPYSNREELIVHSNVRRSDPSRYTFQLLLDSIGTNRVRLQCLPYSQHEAPMVVTAWMRPAMRPDEKTLERKQKFLAATQRSRQTSRSAEQERSLLVRVEAEIEKEMTGDLIDGVS